MGSEQLDWFAALDEGNIDKLKDLLNGNTGLLEERDENQVIDFTILILTVIPVGPDLVWPHIMFLLSQ